MACGANPGGALACERACCISNHRFLTERDEYMADLLTLQNLGNLLMLCFLQAVLGFDNLLYISIQSQRLVKILGL